MLSSVRLYFDIAVGVLIVGVVVFAGWLYDQHKLDTAKLSAAGVAMTQLQAGIRSLQQGQAASDEAINNVEDALLHGGQHAAMVRQRVVTMGNNDDPTRIWLDTHLPSNGCMLDDTCPSGAAASAAQRGAAATLPASAAH